ncbi:MAG TPA: FG-GAP-like repeat-containing protein [Ignavibacteria bacterium]
MNRLYYILILLSLIFSSFAYPQSFTKITAGAIVNDGGWSYGCCWADFNNDGYQDLFVVNNQTVNKNNLLYMNNGNGTFTKVTTGIVVNDGGSSYGCTSADYDNDGYIDLFVTNYGENNFLYHNNGDGTFTKITTGAIVNDGGNSTGCAWGDYDNDGFVDLFVCNRNQPNFLYHNNGNGTFTKITTGTIVTNNSNSGGCAWCDYDNDGYLDLYVANAGPAADFLYHNNGNGTFTQITNDPIVNDVLHSSGGSWGDYNNDGYMDLFVSGGVIGSGEDRLFRNNGNGTFTKITSDPIVTYNHWAGGSSWGDFNNDGYLDMFVGGYDGINLLYSNNGNGTFTRIDTGIIVTDGNYKEGAGWCDYDNDGNLDLFVARNNYFGGNNCLYHNEGTGNKWINIKCVGMISNKAGIGAKLYLKAFINGNTFTQMREISSQSGGSISGQNNLNAFFGLGNAAIIDSIKIVWPSGIIDKYGLIQPNRFLTAVEGQSLTNIEFKENVVPTEFALEQNYPNPFNPVTKIRFEIPLSKGGQRGLYSILKIFDILGKEITTLVNESLKPGTYEVTFNGSNLPSGVYFYRFRAGDFIDTKKLVLFK